MTTLHLPPQPPALGPSAAPPRRPGALLIHGLTGSPTEMAPLEKALRRAGYQTSVPLIAGHGAGHEELLATTWQAWRDSLRGAVHALARTCDGVVVVGLCVGGLLGLLLAADEEAVHGLVCLSPDLGFRIPGPAMPWTRWLLPVAYHVPWLRRHGYWTQQPPYGLKNPRLQQRIAKAVAASVRGQTKDYGTFRTYVGTLRELKRLQAAVRERLARVRCPSLLMQSMEDSLFSIRNVTTMYGGLGSSRKEIALITGCDHVLTADFRKDDVARRVARFMAGCHGAPVEAEPVDDGFLAGEVSLGPAAVRQAAGPDVARTLPMDLDARRTHSLVIRQGAAVRLLVVLMETAAAPRVRLPQGMGELQPPWRLARQAMDALARDLHQHVIIGWHAQVEASRPAAERVDHQRANAPDPSRGAHQDAESMLLRTSRSAGHGTYLA